MFTYTALLWFLPLTAVVVLIHLLNMFRHRRVEWAAVEFLLAGYRKSRMRILFQQFLLMLLRTLAIGTVILMLAGPKLEGGLADWFGGWLGGGTHHIFLLDDSWSMNDRNAALGGTATFDNALAVLRKIMAGVGDTNDRLSLVRLSRANAVVNGEEPDLAELPLSGEGLRLIEEFVESAKPSQLASGPEELLAAAQKLVQRSAANLSSRLKPTVYFVSDFRQRNWENPAPALKHIEAIRRLGGVVRMVRTTHEQHGNLSVENLDVVDGIHAANIDLLVDVTVVNRGLQDVENVNVMLLVEGQTRANQTIPNLAAGKKTVPPLRFPVRLDAGKPQHIEVQLQPDALPDDNLRRLVLDVPATLDVLIITPRNDRASSQYVRVALSPGGMLSGIRPRVEEPSFLTGNPLDSFRAILLLDIPSMETAAVRALEEYATSGGGIAFFLGPHCVEQANIDFVRTELVKNGDGLLPVSPLAETTLEPDFLGQAADVRVVTHPIFRLFGGGESPLLGSIRVEKYVATENATDSDSAILATLRDGQPLVASKNFGQGRCLAFLTTAAPVWNNWARGNPSFVVVMLETVAWLSQRDRTDATAIVGQPLRLQFDSERYENSVKITPPTDGDKEKAHALFMDALVTEKTATATFTRTEQAGFYEAELKERSGATAHRSFAVNVDAQEGEIELADVAILSEVLRPLNVSVESAAGFSADFDFTGQSSLSDVLLLFVILLLVSEIFLAGRILPPVRSAG